MGVVVTILLVIFIPVCVLLILMVLLQAGKGGGLSGAFGGMGANQPFLGTRGTANFLSKLTVYLAITFMVLSLVLSVLYGTSRTLNIKEEVPAADTQTTDTEGATTQPTTSTDSSSQQPASSGAAGSSQTPAGDSSGQ